MIVLMPVLAVGPLVAQDRVPARPQLAAEADTNDWEAYYDAGVDWLNQRHQIDAERAFYWASRLDPRRAEPLFARWAAAWARDAERFQRYLEQDPDKPLPPEMLRIDSLRYRALLRNPLVFQGLIMAAYQELPGRWRTDPWTEAWLAYGVLDFPQALANFARAANAAPDRFGNEARFLRATTYVATKQLDSATSEIDAIIADLQHHEAQHLTHIYQSKSLLYYAIGLLQVSRGNRGAARSAFEQALVEDLSFYPAHLALGRFIYEPRDLPSALHEFEQAATLAANDPVARYEYGAALVQAQRGGEGTAELRAAIALEPYFADSYFWLGEALLAQHDSSGGLAAFQNYVARANANGEQLGRARGRIAALQATHHR